MEHLLHPGERAPIRVPNYQQRPDEEGNVATVDDCARLFDAVIKLETTPPLPADEASFPLWIDYCEKGGVYNLCHGLLDQFYFGLLYQILGPEVVIADFTVRDDNGSVFLSTAKLEYYLLAWQTKVDQLDAEETTRLNSRIYSLFFQAMVIFQSLRHFLNWSYEHVPVKQAYPDDEEPLGNTHFACNILRLALIKAWTKISGMSEDKVSELSGPMEVPWLRKRMEREGWCRYTMTKLLEYTDIDAAAYGYALATIRTDTANHSKCSAKACYANDVLAADPNFSEMDKISLGLHHVNEGCDCFIVATPLADIITILEEGNIPILRIGTDDGYKLTLHARKADPRSGSGNYIAFSHVWIDGLGSPYSNTIAQCQLTRIADRLGKLEATESCGQLSIWVDTLCIPVGPQHARLRELAVTNMHRVYREAYAVIVMDADLLRMETRPSIEELGMRLYLSGWSSRLWTYQEGALNDRLLVVTGSGLLDIDAYIKAAEEDSSAAKLQHQNRGYARSFIETIRGPAAHRLSDSYSTSDDHLEFDKLSQHTFNAMINRRSSRADDEVIVVATCLDLPLSTIFASASEEKMIALLKAMPSIPIVLLFADGARLQTRGFKWAPTAFTRAKNADSWLHIHLDPMAPESVSTQSSQRRSPLRLDSQSRGVYAYLQAIRLDKMFIYNDPSADPDGPYMLFTQSGTSYVFKPVGHNTEPRYMEAKEYVQKVIQQWSDGEKELLILLAMPLGTGVSIRAILVESLAEVDDAEHEDALLVKYIATLTIMSAETVANFLPQFKKPDYVVELLEPRFYLVD